MRLGATFLKYLFLNVWFFCGIKKFVSRIPYSVVLNSYWEKIWSIFENLTVWACLMYMYMASFIYLWTISMKLNKFHTFWNFGEISLLIKSKAETENKSSNTKSEYEKFPFFSNSDEGIFFCSKTICICASRETSGGKLVHFKNWRSTYFYFIFITLFQNREIDREIESDDF